MPEGSASSTAPSGKRSRWLKSDPQSEAVSSWVTFTPTRTLPVLDLVALRWPREYADIFSAGFDILSKKLVFLSTLQDEISRPIQPYDEELEYLPTQVISEYLANVIGLDGIAYKSAQTPAEILAAGPASKNRNVALFGTAAMTTAEPDTKDIESAALQFVEGSQHMFDVTDVRVTYEKNMWAHYEPPSVRTPRGLNACCGSTRTSRRVGRADTVATTRHSSDLDLQ